MSALLEVQGLETAYGSSQVLFGIDLQVESGQVATLLGRNGMGKTTTVRSVLGLTRSKGGTVRFRGERIDQLGADRIARMGLAVVPEGRQIFSSMTRDADPTVAAVGSLLFLLTSLIIGFGLLIGTRMGRRT